MSMRLGNLGDSKRVGGGVLERRIDSGPGYRIYFGRDGDTLILLLAGSTKRRQQQAVAAAQALWQEYKQRKRKEK
jgi:putative addiction module killer protein